MTPIAPEQLHRYWPRVRAGLLDCIKKAGAHYLPEDVYGELKAGTSYLYLLDWYGFAIFQRQRDTDGVVLFVYALWCEPGQGKARANEIYIQIEQLAKGIGARRIRMQGRAGWAKQAFFTETARIYEHELQ